MDSRTSTVKIPQSASIYIPVNGDEGSNSFPGSFSENGGFMLGRSPPRKLQRMRQQHVVELPEDIDTKLNAAEAKREAILQAQKERSSCAFHRAKEVASKVKENIQRDEARLRENLETHMERAQARRERNIQAKRVRALEHLSRVESVHAKAKARIPGQVGCMQTSRRSRQAQKIQSWWRRMQMLKTKGRVEAFQKHKLNAQSVANMSFEELVKAMRSKAVLMDTSMLLRSIEAKFKRKPTLQRSIVRTAPVLNKLGFPVDKFGHFPPRVFLSSLMMVGDPDSIFTEGGQAAAEKDLTLAALHMLRTFDQLCSVLCTNPDPQATAVIEMFASAWKNYLDCFLGWKEPDAQGLAQELVTSYVEMQGLRDRVMAAQPLAEGSAEYMDHDKRIWSEEIDGSMRNLRAHIVRLCPNGTGEEMIHAALDDYCRTQAEEQAAATSDTKNETNVEGARDSASEEPMPASPRSEIDAVLPGEFDEQLAHELLFDPSYTVDGPSSGVWGEAADSKVAKEMTERVQKIAKQAFWDVLSEELQQSPPKYERALAALSDLKDMIKALTPNRKDLAAALDEAIDLSLIRQQLQNDAVSAEDVQRMAQYIISTLIDLQAPARNEATRGWLAEFQRISLPPSALLTKAMAFAVECIEEIRKDVVNAELRLLAAHMKEHGVEYERKKFASALEKGLVSLDETTKWIEGCMREEPELTNKIRRGNSDAYGMMYRTALVKLVTNRDSVAARCPETLRMDIRRLFYLQNEVQRITLLMVSLTIFRQTLAQHSVRATEDEISHLMKSFALLLSDPKCGLPDMEAVMLKCTAGVFEAREVGEMPADASEFVRTMLRKVLTDNDPIYRVLVNRIESVLKHCLVNKEWSDRHVAQGGLEKVSDLVHDLYNKLSMLADVDFKVHVVEYNRIMNEAAPPRRASE